MESREHDAPWRVLLGSGGVSARTLPRGCAAFWSRYLTASVFEGVNPLGLPVSRSERRVDAMTEALQWRARRRSGALRCSRDAHRGRSADPRSGTSPTGPGVSISAASYALNGRPGVSATTRDAHPGGRGGPGLAAGQLGATAGELPQRDHRPGATHLDRRLVRGGAVVHGVHLRHRVRARHGRGFGLLLQVVPDRDAELAVYRHLDAGLAGWTVSILVDIAADDPRVAAALPRTASRSSSPGHPTRRRGCRASGPTTRPPSAQAVRYLAALGHRRLARIAGPPELGPHRGPPAGVRPGRRRRGPGGAHLDHGLRDGGGALGRPGDRHHASTTDRPAVRRRPGCGAGAGSRPRDGGRGPGRPQPAGLGRLPAVPVHATRSCPP